MLIRSVEIDTLSIKYAKKNVHDNALKERITVVAADPAGSIFESLAHG